MGVGKEREGQEGKVQTVLGGGERKIMGQRGTFLQLHRALWQKEADLLKVEQKGRETHGEAARATTTHPRVRLLLPLA